MSAFTKIVLIASLMFGLVNGSNFLVKHAMEVAAQERQNMDAPKPPASACPAKQPDESGSGTQMDIFPQTPFSTNSAARLPPAATRETVGKSSKKAFLDYLRRRDDPFKKEFALALRKCTTNEIAVRA